MGGSRLGSTPVGNQLPAGQFVEHLWYLFPRLRAPRLNSRVVSAFECQLRQSGRAGKEAEQFRVKARLRSEVVVVRRPNGGRLGVMLPGYFEYEGERLRVVERCRFEDEQGARLAALAKGS